MDRDPTCTNLKVSHKPELKNMYPDRVDILLLWSFIKQKYQENNYHETTKINL